VCQREIEVTSDPEKSYVIESILNEKRSRAYSVHELEVDHGTVPTGDDGTTAHGTTEQGQLVAVQDSHLSSKQTRSRNVSEDKKPMDRKVCGDFINSDPYSLDSSRSTMCCVMAA